MMLLQTSCSMSMFFSKHRMFCSTVFNRQNMVELQKSRQSLEGDKKIELLVFACGHLWPSGFLQLRPSRPNYYNATKSCFPLLVYYAALLFPTINNALCSFVPYMLFMQIERLCIQRYRVEEVKFLSKFQGFFVKSSLLTSGNAVPPPPFSFWKQMVAFKTHWFHINSWLNYFHAQLLYILQYLPFIVIKCCASLLVVTSYWNECLEIQMNELCFCLLSLKYSLCSLPLPLPKKLQQILPWIC